MGICFEFFFLCNAFGKVYFEVELRRLDINTSEAPRESGAPLYTLYYIVDIRTCNPF